MHVMSTLMIASWVVVAILIAVNVFIFLKLKRASDQMMKMMFPGAKNMNEAMAKMQQMMRGKGFGGSGGSFGGPGGLGGKNMDAQLKAAMSMLQNAQKGAKR